MIARVTWLRAPDAMRLLSVILAGLCLTMTGGALSAQTPEPSQLRYLAELKQRNVDYGAGCNGIGVSLPSAVAMPDGPTTRWVAGHSACVPGLRLIVSCQGDVLEAERIIGCLAYVADGESSATIDCSALTLITPAGRFHPEAALSQMLSEGSESRARPCSTPSAYTQDLTVAAAFAVPADSSTGDLALLINFDGSEVPAFLIPAAQLEHAAAPSTPAAQGD